LPEGAPQPASGGFAGDVFFYGVGPSYVLYQGERVRIAPVIELVGWRVLGGLETDCVLEMGNSCGTGRCERKRYQYREPQGGSAHDGGGGVHSSFYIGYGHQLTHSVWYEHLVRAEYRYSF